MADGKIQLCAFWSVARTLAWGAKFVSFQLTTYSLVDAAMPTMLKELLKSLVVADLKDLVRYVPGAQTDGRKDELIERIASAMLGAELQSVWKSLDAMQAAAVAEAVHHPQGEFSAQRFRAKYQSDPAFEVSSAKSSHYSSKKKTALVLFIHYSIIERRYFVPADLRASLLLFVPKPAAVQLDSSESSPTDEGLTERQTEREALQEVVVMLRTIEQTRISVGEKTALPSSSTLNRLTDKLVGGDFYPLVEKVDKWEQTIGPIKAFAWPMLLQAGGLAQRTGTRLTLSPTGVKALSTPPADLLRALWRKWLKTTLLDEFSRVDAIKGQSSTGRVMSAVAPRRAAIEDALQECPVGRWVLLSDFSRFMRAADHVFVVTHDPWKLYLCDRQYGSLGYEGSHGWNILQDRYMAAVLFEYAATLGIVDVSYFDPTEGHDDFRSMWGADELRFLSRYDGLNSFRITALGAYILGRKATYQPASQPSNVAISVMPSLQVKLVRGTLTAQDSLLLELWAEPVQTDIWHLDRPKAVAAIENGHDIEVLRQFLENNDDLPLPELVESFLQRCARDGQALKTGASAVLIECRDSETADNVARHKETSSLCLRAGPKTLVVRNEHLGRFRERVHVLGLGLVS